MTVVAVWVSIVTKKEPVAFTVMGTPNGQFVGKQELLTAPFRERREPLTDTVWWA